MFNVNPGLTAILAGGAGLNPAYFYSIINSVDSNQLQVVLDAADHRSYDGSDDTWLDVVNNNHMFLGADASASSNDPTFVGTPGLADESTYFQFDGADFFKETSTHSYPDNWHKNNGTFTICGVLYLAASAFIARSILATINLGSSPIPGIHINLTPSGTISCIRAIDNSTTSSFISSSTVTFASWNFFAIAFDEATGLATIQVNSNQDTFTSLAASTCTDNRTPMHIGASNDSASTALRDEDRLACIAAWNTKISDSSLDSIYNELKSLRFTSLP